METLLVLHFTSNWGKAYVYPKCQQAERLATLSGKKTFSVGNLVLLSMMGFRISFDNIPNDKIELFNQNNFLGFAKFLDNWR